MDNELIKITTKGGKQLVSARELYEFLGLSKRFSVWFETYKSEDYGFTEGEDFTSVLSGTVVNNGAKRELQDYAITIEMAKEISMLSKTKKGKEARKYFIACEKKLKEVKQDSYMISDPIARAKRWIEEEQERQLLLAQVKEQKEKVDKWDIFLNTEGLITVGDFAKVLGKGRNKTFETLRELKILQKDNIPYQKYMKYFKVKQTVKNNKTYKVALINKVGIDYLSNKLKAC